MRAIKKSVVGVTVSCLLIIILLWIKYSLVDRHHWSIRIYSGTNPFNFTPHPLVRYNSALTADDVMDVSARFVADPFMINDNNKWYMFFEVLNALSEQGDIGLASSDSPPSPPRALERRVLIDGPRRIGRLEIWEAGRLGTPICSTISSRGSH